MTYYPSGSIAIYMKIKTLVGERFSDKRRKPYVILNKRKGNVFVIIRRENSTTERTIGIEDTDALNRLYDELEAL